MAIVFTRRDLDVLSEEIKFLSPRYQELVKALAHAALLSTPDETAPDDDTTWPDVMIIVEGSDNVTLPSVSELVDDAFQSGARDSVRGSNSNGKVGKDGKVGKVGKVGRQIVISREPPR